MKIIKTNKTMTITEEIMNAKTDKKFIRPIPAQVMNAVEKARQHGTMLSFEEAKMLMKCLDFNDKDAKEAYYIWWKDSIFRDVLPLHPEIYYKL